MSRLETYSIEEIVNLMNRRSAAGAVNPPTDLDYLDIDKKVGKEVLGELADDGIVVVAALPRENGTVRLWFEERQ